MLFHHKIGDFAFLKVFSDKAAEEKQEKPRHKRKIICRGKARSGQPEGGEQIRKIKIFRNIRFSEEYRSGRKTSCAEKSGKRENSAEQGGGFCNRIPEKIVYHYGRSEKMQNAEPDNHIRHKEICSGGHKHTGGKYRCAVAQSIFCKPAGNSRNYDKGTADTKLEGIPARRIKIKFKSEYVPQVVCGMINYHSDKRKPSKLIKKKYAPAFFCHKSHLRKNKNTPITV